ncbi:MAG TPA: hypothetical protein VIK89_15875 [Cytophagaceae bacterium]
MKKIIIFTTAMISIIFVSVGASASGITGDELKTEYISDSHSYIENAYARAKRVKPTLLKETRPDAIREKYLRHIFGKYAIIYSATA